MNGKQLKNSILQWAIQGKLVPQDSNDEPASVLLEKIRQEKERLIKEKKIKRDKNASIIYRGEDNSYYEKMLATGEVKCIDEEIPFEIPSSWSWARLLNVSIYIQRGKSPKYSPIKKYPVVAQKCNQWAGFSIDKAQFIEPESLSKYAIERILQDEDLMWNSTGLGTLGRMAVYYAKLNPYELAVADSHVTVIRLFKPFVSPLFFYFYFVSPTVQSVIEDKSDGSTKQKELSTTTVCNYLVPIPPRNEQTRIISKVTSLLPVIEKYGTQQEKLENLNRTINEQIKKSVLQEAIQGKLVPQIAEEGTAQKLLEQIKAEKQKLVKEGKLKKSALNDSVIFRGDDNKYYEKIGKKCMDITEEIPFDLPDSWSWARGKSVFMPMESTKPSSDFVYIDVDAVNNRLNIIDKPKKVRIENAPSRATRKLHKNDLLFSMVRPYLKNIALVDYIYKDAIASTGFYVITLAKTEHSHPLGMVVSTHFRCGKGVKRGLKNGALPFKID